METEAITKEERELASKVINTFIQDIASNLNSFCTNNLNE